LIIRRLLHVVLRPLRLHFDAALSSEPGKFAGVAYYLLRFLKFLSGGLCCSGLRGGCEGEASVSGIMIPCPAADDAVFAWIRSERIDEWFF
jgi:hypothetical protein